MKGKACTFFGHRECPDGVKPVLHRVVEGLIVDQGVTMFYVGSQGRFDACVHGVLRQLKKEYPHMDYAVVLAYLPNEKVPRREHENTIFPEGLENAPPRYAICRRNRWMLRQSEFVVAYLTHTWGGAARFVETAERQGKTVIYLSQVCREEGIV